MSLGRETARLALTAWMAGRGGDGMSPDDPARLREDLDACRGALDDARRDFIAAMNHELRTPLNAILGFAQLLEMSGLTDEQRQSLRHVLKGGRHLLQLVNTPRSARCCCPAAAFRCSVSPRRSRGRITSGGTATATRGWWARRFRWPADGHGRRHLRRDHP